MVGFVFLKKVVQALEIAGEILKKIMKAVPAVLRLWVQSRTKEMKGVLSALCCMFESVDEIIINLSFSVVTFNSMLLCRFGTSLFCQVGTKESNKVKLNGREKNSYSFRNLINCTNMQTLQLQAISILKPH